MKWATWCWDLLGVLLIVSQMAAPENVYVDTPVDWHSALQTCRSQGRQLGVARSRDLTEFSGAAGSSVGAWVGGKRVYSRWVWVDNIPLYTHYGCFSDSAVGPKVSAVTQSTQYVYQCLAACGTFSVALKLDVCWCLSGVPDVSLRLSDDSCQTSCTGRFDEMCGDVAAYSIYQRDRLPYILGDFPRVLSTAKETSKCGYIEYVSSDNKTYTLLFDECGDNPASNKRQMCQQCQVTNQETNKQTCVVGKWLGVATWAKTKTFCESMQMNMTTAASENLFLSFTVAKKPFWVGLRLDVVLSWVNGLAINPQNYRTALTYVDGNCLAVKGKAGALQLQLENCDKSKPYFCDVDFPTISDTSTDSSQSVGSTAPSTQTLDYTINTQLPEYTVSTQLTQQEQSSSQTDHAISSSQITIHTSTIQLTKYTSSVELTKHETSSSHIPEFETSSSQSTEFETSSKQIIKDTSTSKMVGITTNSQPGDYETSSTHSVDMTTSSTHLEDTTSTKTQEETTANINPTATFSETTNAALPSPTPALTSTSSLIMSSAMTTNILLSPTPVLTSTSSLRMSSVMTTNILLSLTPSQSLTNRSTSSLSTSFHTTLIITSFTFSQISETRASQITFTMQPTGTSAFSVLPSSIFNTAKQSTNILVESSSTPTIDPTSKISSSTQILSTIEKSTIIKPTIETSTMMQPTIQSTNKISSSTVIESTIEHTNMPSTRTTPVTEQTSIISSTIKETHMLSKTITTTETTNGISSPTMIVITIGETKTLSLPTTQPASGASLSETKPPSTESTVTSLFPSTTVQQSRISQSETVILASPSPSITTEQTNTLDSTSTMQLTNTMATSTNVLPPSTIETTSTLPSSTTKTSQTTTNVLTETETSTIPTETSPIPTETSTIPTGTSTIPTETSTIPTERSTIPTETSTIPTETSTIPTETSTIPTETSTIPTETSTIPTETSTIPTETSTIPTETSTIPTGTSTIPTETSTIPTETSTIPTETSQTYTQPTLESYSEHSRTSQPDSGQSQSDHTTQAWTSASVNPIPGSTPHTTGSAPTHTAAPVKTQDNSGGNKNDIGRSDLLPIYITLGVCLGILVVLVAVTVTLLLRKSHRSTPTSSSWRSSSMNSTSSSKELVSFRPEPRLRARLASERL